MLEKFQQIRNRSELWLADKLRKSTDSTYKFLEGKLNDKTLKKIDSYKPLPFCSLYVKLKQPIPKHFIGHAVYTISQAEYRFRNDDGSESTATWLAASNTPWEPTLTGSNIPFRLRVMVQETGGEVGTSSFTLQYSYNSGTWTAITTTSSYVRLRASSNVTDGATTTNQIGGTGTFNGGQFRETATASTVNHTALGHSEHEYSLELVGGGFTGGNLKFRLIRTESGNPPSSITQTPELFAPTMINSIEELNNIRNSVQGTIIVGNFKLARDLDFNDDDSYDNPANKSTYTTGAGWVALGSTGNPWFGASIDGDGHTISNLMCNASTTGVSNAGFIGVMDAPAAGQTITIQNLGLINPRINANATNSAFNQCGALIMGIDPAGNNIIRNCFVRGGKVVGGTGSGNNGTGGLIGISHEYSGGSVLIENCYVEGTEIYRNGASPGSNNGVGGLVGTFNILTSGNGSFLNITRSYAAAASIGGDSTLNRGGLIGYKDTTTTISGSYYDSTLTPYSGAGGFANTTPKMKNLTSYSTYSWSIVNQYSNLTTQTWWIDEHKDYPRLYYEAPLSLTQSAFRFYNDGTESGSTGLESQGTNHTRTAASGSLNLGLRIRLQDNGTSLLASNTDKYTLKYSLNGGVYSPVTENATIDSFTNAYTIGNAGLSGTLTSYGQTFEGDGNKIVRAAFLLAWNAAISASNAYIKIYSLTGTPGTNAVPATLLATSDAISPSSIPVGTSNKAYVYATFSGANQLQTVDGTHYGVAVEFTGGDSLLYVGADPDGTDSGANGITLQSGSWTATNGSHRMFKVETLKPVSGYNSASLAEGESTTNRLGSGTNSFSAGKVSKDGVVDDYKMVSSNYTELLYSLTIDPSILSTGGTIDFRVERDSGSATTYSAIPRVTITSGGGSSTAGYIKVWTGSSWEYKPKKVYAGGAWTTKPTKVYSGGSWVAKG